MSNAALLNRPASADLAGWEDLQTPSFMDQTTMPKLGQRRERREVQFSPDVLVAES